MNTFKLIIPNTKKRNVNGEYSGLLFAEKFTGITAYFTTVEGKFPNKKFDAKIYVVTEDRPVNDQKMECTIIAKLVIDSQRVSHVYLAIPTSDIEKDKSRNIEYIIEGLGDLEFKNIFVLTSDVGFKEEYWARVNKAEVPPAAQVILENRFRLRGWK